MLLWLTVKVACALGWLVALRAIRLGLWVWLSGWLRGGL